MDRSNKAFVIVDLAFGDCGKGAATDFLCRKYNAELVVLYTGGPQSAHNVVLPDGTHHTFAQFGSGSLIPSVKTHISRFRMVNPISMVNEEEYLRKIGVDNIFHRTTVDGRCLIVTPFDKALNIIREQQRGKKAHGSCGMGIGETRLYHNTYFDDALFAEDLKDRTTTRLKLKLKYVRAIDVSKSLCISLPIDGSIINELSEQYMNWTYQIAIGSDYFLKYDLKEYINIIFEGSQGVLLDQRDEFAPNNTWADTTTANADTLLKEAGFDGDVVRVGCIRSYMTRHGAGPFNDCKELDTLPEPHNTDACFQGKFRRGYFDKSAVIKALDVCGGVDEIHMSHVDYLPKIHPGMTEQDIELFVRNVERFTETPITVLGYGSTHEDRRERSKAFTARRRSTEIRAGISCGATG